MLLLSCLNVPKHFIILSVFHIIIQVQGENQNENAISENNDLATENGIEYLNVKSINRNIDQSTDLESTRNFTTNLEDYIDICHYNHNQTNETDGLNEVTSSNQKSNESDIPCCLPRDEFMRRLYDYLRPGVLKWILIFSHIVVFTIGLTGNALVCLAVYVNYSMRTVTNIFIVNLAVADFLVILVCLPPSVVWDITETWFLGETMCKIVLYFQTVSVTVSVMTLTLISIDRWYAICFPLRYRTQISKAITSVSIIWIIAILADVPEFLSLTVVHSGLCYDTILFSQCSPIWDDFTERKFYMIKLVALYVLPLLLMISAYFKIATVLWKSDALLVGLHSSTQQGKSANSRILNGTGISNRGTISQLQARRKAAKMMVVVVIMFAICYLPVHAFNIMRHSGYIEPGEITKILALISHWLCYANSAINPLIYNFMSGKFRREFRNAFVKCGCVNVRVEDNFIYKNRPSSRQQNNSLSARSYRNLSVREITRVPFTTTTSQKNEDSHL